MPKIIRDFVSSGKLRRGVGFWEDDHTAVEVARTMGKNQIHQFERYGKVPGAFFRYLKEKGLIPEATDTSRKAAGKSAQDLLEFLWRCPCTNEEARDALESMRKSILVWLYPEIRRSFADQDRAWEKLEHDHKLRKRTGKSPSPNREVA